MDNLSKLFLLAKVEQFMTTRSVQIIVFRDCVRLAIRKITYAPEQPQPQVSFFRIIMVKLTLIVTKINHKYVPFKITSDNVINHFF